MNNSVSSCNNIDSFDLANNDLTTNKSNINEKYNNNNLIFKETDHFEIKGKSTREIGTQTNFNYLYKEEEKLIKKNRKYQADLIRDKIFKFFNKMIYNWLKSPEKEKDNDDIVILNFHFQKNNKSYINDSMNKLLKDLFIYPEKDLEEKIKKINNDLLKYKLGLGYKYVYNIFTSNKVEIKESEEFLKGFVFLDEYIEQLKEKEKYEKNDEYFVRLKTVALNYNDWKDKKARLWKNKLK